MENRHSRTSSRDVALEAEFQTMMYISQICLDGLDGADNIALDMGWYMGEPYFLDQPLLETWSLICDNLLEEQEET